MATSTVQFAPLEVQNRKDLDLRAGDTVRVHVKIQERGKTRIQIFEGLVLARKHGSESGATFTVRKISNGVGVERIFPLYAPMIDKIEIVKRSRVRRSKLYYIRTKVSRDIRRKMRNFVDFTMSTDELVPIEAMLNDESPESEPETQSAETMVEDTEKEATKAPAEVEQPESETVKEQPVGQAKESEPESNEAKGEKQSEGEKEAE